MRPDRPGVALMLVLWLVVVLGAVAAAVVALSRSDANAVVAYRSRAVARAAAESGVELALARIRSAYRNAVTEEDQARVLDRLRSGIEGAPRALGDGRFQVALEDPTGRLAINQVDYPTLLRFFTLTADADRAPALAAAVLDWKDPDDAPRPDGAEASAYERAGSPFRPLNRPFQRIEEVPRLLGVDDSLAATLLRTVSVHGGGPVNVNSAPAVVLAAVTGIELDAAERIVRARDVEPFVVLDGVRTAGGLDPGYIPVSLTPTLLQVVSRGWYDGRPYTREERAMVELRGWDDPGGLEVVVVARDARDL